MKPKIDKTKFGSLSIAIIPNTNPTTPICRHVKIEPPTGGDLLVDPAGFEPAISSVRWLKIHRMSEKMVFITSTITDFNHADRALLHSIAPELHQA